MAEDAWAALVDVFADGAYATVKGQVRTFVLHRQLLQHLPPPPAKVLDVGGGAAHQSLPLARMGYQVTVLDASAAMLDKARKRLQPESEEVRARVRLLEGSGERASELTAGERFDAVLCLGVLLYLDDPEPLVRELCRCAKPGGIVSVMTLNAAMMAARPALEGRWRDALTAFDAKEEEGKLGVHTRADTVESLSESLRANEVEPQAWYGVLLFTDWRDVPLEGTDVRAVAEVELVAGSREPYRSACRAFHLVGRRTPAT